MENRLIGSSSPHILSNQTTSKIMLDVLIALAPATIASVYFFKFAALKLIILAVVSSVVTEAIFQKSMKKTVTISDFSAALTGLLLAFNIPASAPWWIPVVGSIFAIGIVKQLFGGIGNNFMNPALAARAFLLASWPVIMTTWIKPGPDATTAATTLAILKPGGEAVGQQLPSLWDAFVGNIPGSLGETSALLLIVGGIYLLWRGVINWRIPLTYIGTVALIMFIYHGSIDVTLYHIFSGGLMLGAFYMATDYTTAPVTPKGQIIFAVGCGLITSIIRLKGGYPEGVCYSILLMNVAAPLIERYTSPKVFGGVK